MDAAATHQRARSTEGTELSLAELIAAAMPQSSNLPASGKNDPSSSAAPIALIAQQSHSDLPASGKSDVSHVNEGEVIGVVPGTYDPDPEWLLHQTDMLRRPIYRTERGENGASPANSSVASTTADGQIVFAYRYDDETEIQSTLGELNCRDMLVMSAIQQAFHRSGCPASGLLSGPSATLYHLARQVGLVGGERTNLVKESLGRLHQAKVTIRFRNTERALRGGYPVNVKGEITFGFISATGFRERSSHGERDVSTESFIRIDQTLGDLIRGGHFTFLKAEVLRKLRRHPVALKLYTWARTHEPNNDGFLMPHRISTLADKLGVQDTNVTRRRQKVLAALEDIKRAAPDEFPGYETRSGSARSADPVIQIRRRKVALGEAVPARVMATVPPKGHRSRPGRRLLGVASAHS